MTKVEIDGKTYCVETLIYTIERLTKEVKASAEYHRLVLDKIRAEIKGITPTYHNPDWSITDLVPISEVLDVVDKYKTEGEIRNETTD